MSRKQLVPFVLIAAFSIFVLWQPGPAARGQSEAGTQSRSTGRFQVATFSTDGTPGYYIIDTMTGELWHNYRSNKPSRVSGPLSTSR